MVVFTSIATLASVIAKNRTWMSILICLAITMLLFNMIPMITPLRANIINVILCIGGSLLFSIGFTLISNLILQKTDISR